VNHISKHQISTLTIIQLLQFIAMSKSTVFSEADQALMIAIFRQMGIGKIDYEKIRIDLGLPTKNAAQMRVTRLRAKLEKGGAMTSPSSTPKSTVRLSFKNSSKSDDGGYSKKRKMSESDADNEEEVDMLEVKDEESIQDSANLVLENPTRRLPHRQARVTSFKEVDSGDDLAAGEDLFEDLGGNGGASEESEHLARSPSDEEA
jgi:hypothetical protein